MHERIGIMNDEQSNPNRELSRAATDALLAADLITMESQEQVFKKFCSGTARVADWKFWAETVVDQEAQEVADAHDTTQN